MNAEMKATWIAALRGGGFKQTTGVLHDPEDGGYCCLGVLCEVTGYQKIYGSDSGGERYRSLAEMVDPAGASDQVGFYSRLVARLVDMNDLENKSFTEIADYIERTL